MHCNLRQPDAAQSPSALISSPVPSLKLLMQPISVVVLERFYCSYVTLRCDLELWSHDLDLWPLTLNNFIVSRLSHDQTLYEIWATSGNPRQSYCDVTLWPWNEHVSRVALCFGIVCTKFKLSQAIRSWNITIFWC